MTGPAQQQIQESTNEMLHSGQILICIYKPFRFQNTVFSLFHLQNPLNTEQKHSFWQSSFFS